MRDRRPKIAPGNAYGRGRFRSAVTPAACAAGAPAPLGCAFRYGVPELWTLPERAHRVEAK
jgi:hypothetical protein